jgi:hypothetical protein
MAAFRRPFASSRWPEPNRNSMAGPVPRNCWGQHQGTNPGRLVKFLPEDNRRFEDAQLEPGGEVAPRLAAVPAGDDPIRDQHRLEKKRYFQSAMDGGGY